MLICMAWHRHLASRFGRVFDFFLLVLGFIGVLGARERYYTAGETSELDDIPPAGIIRLQTMGRVEAGKRNNRNRLTERRDDRADDDGARKVTGFGSGFGSAGGRASPAE